MFDSISEPENIKHFFFFFFFTFTFCAVKTEHLNVCVVGKPSCCQFASSVSLFILDFQKLQQELEFLEVQEEYIKDEQKNLKKEFLHAQEEVKRIQSIPLVIGQFLEAVDQNTAIVGSTTGDTDGSFPFFLQLVLKRNNPLLFREVNIKLFLSLL